MLDALFALRSAVGFLTTIPVGISMEGIEAMMRHIYLFPSIGLLLGLLYGTVARFLSPFLPAGLVAVIVLLLIYKLCGINHIDGLADFVDGITAHGDREKKIRAMKDVHLGSAGGLYIALILIVLFYTMSALPSTLLPLALVAAEVSAKQSMIGFAAFSRPFQKGFGQMMIEKAGMRDFLAGLAISALLCAGILGPLGLAMLGLSLSSSLYLVAVSKRNFGGGSGDGIGASNEISRGIALISCLALMEVLPWTPW
ncbi:MAG: adenosylcobinamide-GDP ribazoletransferase [Methanotrichaceae archaeon]|nr:adenosylcobinamide-GDP ribazoletransferase [Methanotrichaceae archaeon]